MRFWSLFSGVGGFDLGLERAGMRGELVCESDPWRRRALAARFSDAVVTDDVAALRLEPETRGEGDGRGSVSDGTGRIHSVALPGVLAGGFPCQDLSVAGKRAGLSGERSGLFFEFARIADELRLAERGGWILLENVPGLLSSNGGRDFGVVLATLADLGLSVAYRVLNSQHFGVPQRRRRVFIVGHSRADYARAVLFESEGGGGDPETRGAQGPEVAVASLSGLGNGGPDDAQGGRLVANTLTCHEVKGGDPTTDNYVVPALVSRSSRGHAQGLSAGFNTDGHVVATLRSHPRPGSNDVGALAVHLTQDPISGEVAQGASVRRLTPRECERLQGFPDDWTAVDGEPTYALTKGGQWRAKSGTPDSKRYAAMGDAVTVNVIEWIGRRMMAVQNGALA